MAMVLICWLFDHDIARAQETTAYGKEVGGKQLYIDSCSFGLFDAHLTEQMEID